MTVSVRSANGVVGTDHGFERSALTNSVGSRTKVYP
jgi:hypothetical protein